MAGRRRDDSDNEALRIPPRTASRPDPPAEEMQRKNLLGSLGFGLGFLAVSAVAKEGLVDPLVLPVLLVLLFVLPAVLTRLLPEDTFALPTSRDGEVEPDFKWPWQ